MVSLLFPSASDLKVLSNARQPLGRRPKGKAISRGILAFPLRASDLKVHCVQDDTVIKSTDKICMLLFILLPHEKTPNFRAIIISTIDCRHLPHKLYDSA